MSWFRSSYDGGSSTSAANKVPEKVPIEEAVKVLSPPSSGHSRSDGPQERNRFSQLLLEHGEKHLQDWAVRASSTVVSKPSQRSSPVSRRSSDRVSRSFSQSSSSLSVTQKGRSSIKRMGSMGSSDHKLVSSPTTNMGKIEGRLHLCSSSIVFEPTDTTRGIVRCSFTRMESHPSEISSEEKWTQAPSSSSESSSVVEFECSRHVVMKTNNVIGPFDSVEIPVRFRFTFLHSSPERFVEVSQKLFQSVKGDKHRNSRAASLLTPEIDEIMKPMLDRPFDPSNFVDIRERPLTSNLRCSLMTPLQSKSGCVILTNERIYFQPVSGVLNATVTKAISWPQQDVMATARRYNGLRDNAAEIFWKDGSSVLLAFDRKREREQLMRLMPKNVRCHTDREFVVEVAKAWQKGAISNYEYLLALNSAAGRSFHDLSRYPVFPWVIADYESSSLDLASESTFRDLNKPVGALNEERLEYFRTRLQGMQDMEDPFLYGTHYSAPGYVLYYLVRSMPEHMLCLQNGKFDAPDRMFHSMQHCYSCVLTNHADVKELIPEFYNPSGGFDFLINARSLQLGATQNGDRVHDVELPPWAKSARDFLRKNRKALESDICTRMLPRWIDLIFGWKSRGEGAMEASNLFHRVTYLGPADLESMESDQERFQAELQATEFGIVPDLLFCGPHPLRQDPIAATDDLVALDSGRAPVERDGEAEAADGDSPKNDQQAWELLDAPSNSSTDGSRTIDRVDSIETAPSAKIASGARISPTPSVGFGASALVPSAKMRSFSGRHPMSPSSPPQGCNEPLATRGGKAKASWGSNLSIPSEDVDDSQTKDNSNGTNTRFFSSKHMENNGTIREQSDGRTSQNESTKAQTNPQRSFPLSGTGELSRGDRRYEEVGWSYSFSSHGSNEPNSAAVNLSAPGPTSPDQTDKPTPTEPPKGWDMKIIAKNAMHGDTVSGCSLIFEEGTENRSFLTTVSLDGRLMVHTLSLGSSGTDSYEQARRAFAGTLSRFASMGRGGRDPGSSQATLNSHRSHSGSDPLACLALSSDGHSGKVVFAGGHDDVVLAYGINSACAVASVYSHRDAVTGLDLIERSPFSASSALWSEKATHIMVSGSWDATVKVWSVVVAAGETVSINREPLAELFDADSTIVCISATAVLGIGIAICAGCADGSFVVWLCQNDGRKEVIHKEPAKRGSGPCSAVRWITVAGKIFLFTGSSTGKVASFMLSDRKLRFVSAVSVGVPVQCLECSENILLAGCADGGLRLIPIRQDGYFDSKPTLWNAVNGESAPGLTCISLAFSGDAKEGIGRCICSTGAEDGSVALFELKKVE